MDIDMDMNRDRDIHMAVTLYYLRANIEGYTVQKTWSASE